MSAPVEFAVWAPLPERLRIQVDGAVHDMQRGDGGWWRAEVEAGPEADYGFLVGGNDTPRPDPRSRRQPEGVHGLSRRFDPDAHEWGDGAWTGRPLAGGVVYELHVGTFTPEGTLDAAIGRLGHLVRLGVDFVELLPVNAFNGTHNWGYDGVLWYAVQESYGGPAAYQRFVDACHQQGLGVIQDVVYNHLGPSGNYLPEFFPIFAEGGANTWGNSINLSGPDSDEVRRYVIDNALMWLRDMHVDGLRLDAVHALVDERATHVLEEMAREVDRLSVAEGRPLTLIAESDLNDPRMVTPRVAGGLGIHAQWSDDFHHALHAVLTGEGQGYYGDFAKVPDHWGHWNVYTQPEGSKVPYTGMGGFFRVKADGSNFRVVASGTRGSVGIAMDRRWNLFSNDNDHESIADRYSPARLLQARSPSLDLDCLYGLGPALTPDFYSGARLRVGVDQRHLGVEGADQVVADLGDVAVPLADRRDVGHRHLLGVRRRSAEQPDARDVRHRRRIGRAVGQPLSHQELPSGGATCSEPSAAGRASSEPGDPGITVRPPGARSSARSRPPRRDSVAVAAELAPGVTVRTAAPRVSVDAATVRAAEVAVSVAATATSAAGSASAPAVAVSTAPPLASAEAEALAAGVAVSVANPGTGSR